MIIVQGLGRVACRRKTLNSKLDVAVDDDYRLRPKERPVVIGNAGVSLARGVQQKACPRVGLHSRDASTMWAKCIDSCAWTGRPLTAQPGLTHRVSQTPTFFSSSELLAWEKFGEDATSA